MTKNEIKAISVINPYNDTMEDCTCYMELQYEDNGKFVGGNLHTVITEGGCDLFDYLKDEWLDEIEQKMLEVLEV